MSVFFFPFLAWNWILNSKKINYSQFWENFILLRKLRLHLCLILRRATPLLPSKNPKLSQKSMEDGNSGSFNPSPLRVEFKAFFDKYLEFSPSSVMGSWWKEECRGQGQRPVLTACTKKAFVPTDHAQEHGPGEAPALFYLQFANVGCKTWMEIWTKTGSKTVPLPSSDPKASRSNPLKRRLASCSHRNGESLLGVWLVVFGQQRGGKTTSKPYVGSGVWFYSSMLIGSAVFSTEFLDKAQFFPWPEAALISEMWLWCILCLHAM